MGKQRSGSNKKCASCGEIFYIPKYREKTAKFCSLYCQNHGQYKKHIFKCKNCGTQVTTSLSRERSGKKFCSILCRDAAKLNEKERRARRRSLESLRIRAKTTRHLRKNIFQIREPTCEICGYKEYQFCLDLHHKDGDCTNNIPENIMIVCAICHRILHKEKRK